MFTLLGSHFYKREAARETGTRKELGRMKAPLYNKQGNKKAEVVLNPKIFASRVNHRLLELIHKA